MNPQVFVDNNIVDIEFTLADDARFNVCLGGQDLEELLYKLLMARDHVIVWKTVGRKEME